MSYHEDGEALEDLASFTGNGFESFPSLYHDSQRLHEVMTWSGELLAERITEYDKFLDRTDLMPRAAATAGRTLDHMLFELEAREPLRYDELCEGR